MHESAQRTSSDTHAPGSDADPSCQTPTRAEAPLPESLTGLPGWITRDLIHETIRVWQPFYKVKLTWDDAVAMLKNVAALSHVAFGRGTGAAVAPASPG
jgi:hypothetical protein